MTAQGEDILAWLNDAISAREDAARAAHETDPAPWSAQVEATPTFDHARDAGSGLLIAANGDPLWDCEGASGLCMTAAASAHAAMHDPESVLRRCAADRKLLDLHGGRGHGCPALDDDGDVDNHAWFYDHELCPVVEHLAAGYGWTGGDR